MRSLQPLLSLPLAYAAGRRVRVRARRVEMVVVSFMVDVMMLPAPC
jgi:hypothetical protein